MPTYRVTDSVTGKQFDFTGDSPPTEDELKEFFDSQVQPQQESELEQPEQQKPDAISDAASLLARPAQSLLEPVAGIKGLTPMSGQQQTPQASAQTMAPAPEKEQAPQDPGLLSAGYKAIFDLAPQRALAAGVIGAMRNYVSPFAIESWAPGATTAMRKMGEWQKSIGPKPTGNPIIDALQGATESASTSITTMLPFMFGRGKAGAGAEASKAAPALRVGRAILAKGGLFGTAQYFDFMDEVVQDLEKRGASKAEIEEAKDKLRPWAAVSGGAEAGGEILSDVLSAKIFGLLGSPAKQAVKDSVTKVGLKYAKKFGLNQLAEQLGEQFTTGVQYYASKEAGKEQAPLWEQMKQTGLQTLFQSVLQGGFFTGVSQLADRRLANNIVKNTGLDYKDAKEVVTNMHSDAEAGAPHDVVVKNAVKLIDEKKKKKATITIADVSRKDTISKESSVKLDEIKNLIKEDENAEALRGAETGAVEEGQVTEEVQGSSSQDLQQPTQEGSQGSQAITERVQEEGTKTEGPLETLVIKDIGEPETESFEERMAKAISEGEKQEQEKPATPAVETKPIPIGSKAITRRGIEDGLESGEIEDDTPVRTTNLKELKYIMKNKALYVGKDAEGNPGISATLMAKGRPFVNYGEEKDSIAIIFPKDSVEGTGVAVNEVKIDPKTDITKLRFVIDGKIVSYNELREQRDRRAKVRESVKQDIKAKSSSEARDLIPVTYAGVQKFPDRPGYVMVNLPPDDEGRVSTVAYNPSYHYLPDAEKHLETAKNATESVAVASQKSVDSLILQAMKEQAAAKAAEATKSEPEEQSTEEPKTPKEARAKIVSKRREVAKESKKAEKLPVFDTEDEAIDWIIAREDAGDKTEYVTTKTKNGKWKVLVDNRPELKPLEEAPKEVKSVAPKFVTNSKSFMFPNQAKTQLEILSQRKVETSDPNIIFNRIKASINHWFHTGEGNIDALEEELTKLSDAYDAAYKAGKTDDKTLGDNIVDLSNLIFDMKKFKSQAGFIDLTDIVKATEVMTRWGQIAFETGARTFNAWVSKMQTWFGEKWEQVKHMANVVWNRLVELNEKLGIKGELRLWRGAKTDKFRMEDIGARGNGLVFGWGFYFSELRRVAEFYARGHKTYKVKLLYDGKPLERPDGMYRIAWDKFIDMIREAKLEWETNSPEGSLVDWYKATIPIEDWVSRRFEESIPTLYKELMNILDSIDPNKLTEYVDPKLLIDATVHKGKQPSEYVYLDWYEEIPEDQLDMIKRKLEEKELFRAISAIDELIEEKKANDEILDGCSIYKELDAVLGSQKAASLFLLEAGIDGVVYPVSTLRSTNPAEYKRYQTAIVFEGFPEGTFDLVLNVNIKDPGFQWERRSLLLHFLKFPEPDRTNRIINYIKGYIETAKIQLNQEKRRQALGRGNEEQLKTAEANLSNLISLLERFEKDSSIIKEVKRKRQLDNNYVIFDPNAITVENVVTLDFMGLSQIWDAMKWAAKGVAKAVSKINWGKIAVTDKEFSIWRDSWEARKLKSLPKPQVIEVAKNSRGVPIMMQPTQKDIFILKSFLNRTSTATQEIPAVMRLGIMIRDAELDYHQWDEIGREYFENIASKLSKEEQLELTKLSHEMQEEDKKYREFLNMLYPKTHPRDLDFLVNQAIRQLVLQRNVSDKVKEAWQNIQDNYVIPMRNRILNQWRKEILRYLEHGEAIKEVLSGRPIRAVWADYEIDTTAKEKAFLRDYKSYIDQVEELEKWPIGSYATRIMRGNILVKAIIRDPITEETYTKIVTVATNPKEAAAQALAYSEAHPTVVKMLVDTTGFKDQDTPILVNRKTLFSLKRSITKLIEETVNGIDKSLAESAAEQALHKNVTVAPARPLPDPLKDTKSELPGMENILDAWIIYNRVVNRWLAYSDAILYAKGIIGDLPQNARENILDALKWSQGAYSLTDRVIDEVIDKIADKADVGPRPKFVGTKVLGATRGLMTSLLLGYRLVPALYNLADNLSKPWLVYGSGVMKEGLALLLSPEGRALIQDNSSRFGYNIIQDEGGKLSIVSRSRFGTTRGLLNILKPLGVFGLMEVNPRELHYCAVYNWIRKKEPTLGHEAWKDFANLSLEQLQRLGTLAEAPMPLRKPGPRTTIGFLQNYVIALVETFARYGWSPVFWGRYFTYLMTICGPAGIWYMIKALPFIGLVAGMFADDDDALIKIGRDLVAGKYLLTPHIFKAVGMEDTELAKTVKGLEMRMVHGIPGLLDLTNPASATWQLPGNLDDFFGANVRAVSLIVNGLISGDYTGYNATNAIEKDFKRIAPMFRGLLEAVESMRTGGMVLDRNGDPFFRLNTWGERLINQTGFRTIEREFESQQAQILRSHDRRRNAALDQLVDAMVQKINYGKPEEAGKLAARYAEILEKYGPVNRLISSNGQLVNPDITRMKSRLSKAQIMRSDKVTIRNALEGQIDALEAQQTFEENFIR